MSFNAKLHIQGVGCFEPQNQNKQLLVLFPKGTDGPVCIHLNFVQFRARHLGSGLDGYLTQFLDHELLTIDTGAGGGIQDLDIDHLPSMVEALPHPADALKRAVAPALLHPLADDDRLIGKLLVTAGNVTAHSHPRYKKKWYFHEEDEARDMSSVTTVTYTGIDRFDLKFRKLGPAGVERTVPLGPHPDGPLEVWVRNMCDGTPPEEQNRYADPSDKVIPKDEDFILNYNLRGLGENDPRPIPTVLVQVGGEMHKCLGSR